MAKVKKKTNTKKTVDVVETPIEEVKETTKETVKEIVVEKKEETQVDNSEVKNEPETEGNEEVLPVELPSDDIPISDLDKKIEETITKKVEEILTNEKVVEKPQEKEIIVGTTGSWGYGIGKVTG